LYKHHTKKIGSARGLHDEISQHHERIPEDDHAKSGIKIQNGQIWNLKSIWILTLYQVVMGKDHSDGRDILETKVKGCGLKQGIGI